MTTFSDMKYFQDFVMQRSESVHLSYISYRTSYPWQRRKSNLYITQKPVDYNEGTGKILGRFFVGEKTEEEGVRVDLIPP